MLLSVILSFGDSMAHHHATITGESGDLELCHVQFMLGVLARLSLLACPHLSAMLAVRLAFHPMTVGGELTLTPPSTHWVGLGSLGTLG